MSSLDNKKYFWLKLEKDFFKKHDIEIVEAMPNGKDYILFYLKLLCESISHEGRLRFSDTIPYSEDMLSTITRTNVDIVRSAIKIFSELKMIEVLDDGTLYLNEVQKMIGNETYGAQRKREYRSKEKMLEYEPTKNKIREIKKRYETAMPYSSNPEKAETLLNDAIKQAKDIENIDIEKCYRIAFELVDGTISSHNQLGYIIETIRKENK